MSLNSRDIHSQRLIDCEMERHDLKNKNFNNKFHLSPYRVPKITFNMDLGMEASLFMSQSHSSEASSSSFFDFSQRFVDKIQDISELSPPSTPLAHRLLPPSALVKTVTPNFLLSLCPSRRIFTHSHSLAAIENTNAESVVVDSAQVPVVAEAHAGLMMSGSRARNKMSKAEAARSSHRWPVTGKVERSLGMTEREKIRFKKAVQVKRNGAGGQYNWGNCSQDVEYVTRQVQQNKWQAKVDEEKRFQKQQKLEVQKAIQRRMARDVAPFYPSTSLPLASPFSPESHSLMSTLFLPNLPLKHNLQDTTVLKSVGKSSVGKSSASGVQTASHTQPSVKSRSGLKATSKPFVPSSFSKKANNAVNNALNAAFNKQAKFILTKDKALRGTRGVKQRLGKQLSAAAREFFPGSLSQAMKVANSIHPDIHTINVHADIHAGIHADNVPVNSAQAEAQTQMKSAQVEVKPSKKSEYCLQSVDGLPTGWKVRGSGVCLDVPVNSYASPAQFLTSHLPSLSARLSQAKVSSPRDIQVRHKYDRSLVYPGANVHALIRDSLACNRVKTKETVEGMCGRDLAVEPRVRHRDIHSTRNREEERARVSEKSKFAEVLRQIDAVTLKSYISVIADVSKVAPTRPSIEDIEDTVRPPRKKPSELGVTRSEMRRGVDREGYAISKNSGERLKRGQKRQRWWALKMQKIAAENPREFARVKEEQKDRREAKRLRYWTEREKRERQIHQREVDEREITPAFIPSLAYSIPSPPSFMPPVPPAGFENAPILGALTPTHSPTPISSPFPSLISNTFPSTNVTIIRRHLEVSNDKQRYNSENEEKEEMRI